MNLQPPPTRKEIDDLRKALGENIPEQQFAAQEAWFIQWGTYLIGLRRGYQSRFLSEAYNEHSPHT